MSSAPKSAGFVAARASSYLHDDVVVLVGVFGEQGYFQFLRVFVQFAAQSLRLLFQEFPHLVIALGGEHILALLKLPLVGEISFIFLGGGSDVGMFLGIIFERILIGHHFGTRQKLPELGIPRFELVQPQKQLFAHFHAFASSFLLAESILSLPCISRYISTSNAANSSFRASACPTPNSRNRTPPSAR